MVETTHLGKPTPIPASPEEAKLDYVPNPRPGALYLVRFAARQLGNRDSRLYDGSWSEWGADPSTPKETGPA